MQVKNYVCECCGRMAEDEKQLRRENWLRIEGGIGAGIEIWLEKPINKAYMISIGWMDRQYDFCSIECLVKILKAKKSI